MSEPLLTFAPEQCLEFQFDSSGYFANLYVSNSSVYPVAFKVKTNNPDRYLVRPNQGVLGSQTDNLEVRVVVIGEPLATLASEIGQHPGEDYTPPDKFLVQYIALTSHEFAAFNVDEPQVLQQKLNDLWSNQEYKPRILSHRMKCTYKWVDYTEGTADGGQSEQQYYPDTDAGAHGGWNDGSVGGIVVDGKDETSSPSSGGGVVGTTGTGTGTGTGSGSGNRGIVRGSSGTGLFTGASTSVSVPLAVPQSQSQAQVQQYSGNTSSSIMTTVSQQQARDNSLTFEQMKELRDKYNTLVNESVRMTAQLGDLTNALEEKTAQVTNLQDEIRSLKAQVDAGAIPATAGLRKRGKPGSDTQQQEPATQTEEVKPAPATSRGGVPILLALVLAALMFVVGRLLK